MRRRSLGLLLVSLTACLPSVSSGVRAPRVSVEEAPARGEAEAASATPQGSEVTGAVTDGSGPSTAVVDVSIGDFHACALDTAGGVYCWGLNRQNQLGDGSQVDHRRPTLVEGLGPAKRVVAGLRGACAVTTAGKVFCWGEVAGRPLSRPTEIEGVDGASEVSIGRSHACAVAGGAVRCWGSNANGQLGSGSMDSIEPTTVVTVAGLKDASALALAGESSCALKTNGDVVCWGNRVAKRTRPAAVSGAPKLNSLAHDYRSFCGVTAKNEVYCWGENYQNPFSAMKSRTWANVDKLAMGFTYHCAIGTDRTVRCKGSSPWGASGLEPNQSTFHPHEVSGFGPVSNEAAISAGGLSMTCVVDRGELACLGSNRFGMLGIGDGAVTNDRTTVPFRVRL